MGSWRYRTTVWLWIFVLGRGKRMKLLAEFHRRREKTNEMEKPCSKRKTRVQCL